MMEMRNLYRLIQRDKRRGFNHRNPKQFLSSEEIEIYRQNLGLDRDIIKKRIHYVALRDFDPVVDSEGIHCLNCGKILPKRKRKYCSSGCSNEFFAKHNWNAMSARISKKQNWTCQKCGAQPPRDENGHLIWTNDKSKYDYFLYVVDHIIPIALGGEEFDESNLQVLCGDCNREKTKEDQAKIAKKRGEVRLVRNPFEVEIKSLFVKHNTLDNYSERL